MILLRNLASCFALVILSAGVLLMSNGCQTTEYVADSKFEVISTPPGKPSSILDSRMKVLQSKAKEYPRRSDLYYKMAVLYFQQEDFRNAAKYVKKAISLDPNHVLYRYDLGRIHLQMGELEQAEEAFRKALENVGEKRWSGLYSTHGYTLCHLRRWEDARKQFEISVELNRLEKKKDPTPFYFLGSIADIQKDTEKAVRYMRNYLEDGGKSYRRRALEVLSYHGVEVETVAGIIDDSREVAIASANSTPSDDGELFQSSLKPKIASSDQGPEISDLDSQNPNNSDTDQ